MLIVYHDNIRGTLRYYFTEEVPSAILQGTAASKVGGGREWNEEETVGSNYFSLKLLSFSFEAPPWPGSVYTTQLFVAHASSTPYSLILLKECGMKISIPGFYTRVCLDKHSSPWLMPHSIFVIGNTYRAAFRINKFKMGADPVSKIHYPKYRIRILCLNNWCFIQKLLLW
jgi:hypothetical protein